MELWGGGEPLHDCRHGHFVSLTISAPPVPFRVPPELPPQRLLSTDEIGHIVTGGSRKFTCSRIVASWSRMASRWSLKRWTSPSG